MNKPEWKDVTSYDRRDTVRDPKTFTVQVGDLRICVTCDHIYHKPNWVMHCAALNIDTKRLKATNLEEAKVEAIDIVKFRLATLSSNIKEVA